MREMFEVLSDAEIETLGEFLLNRIDDDTDTEGKDEGIFDISTLDGFFTAIVSGPVMVPPSQWLPAVWGDFEPVWEDEDDFKSIFMLMMRHMNGIMAMLMEGADDFEPIYMERDVKGKVYTIVDEWCEGYLRAVALTGDQWRAGGADMDILLTPIAAFTSTTNWRGHDFNEIEVENIKNAIAPNVREIHAFWLERRGDDMSSSQPARRQEPKVGRNDPCPCGSGKKYKRCCLH